MTDKTIFVPDPDIERDLAISIKLAEKEEHTKMVQALLQLHQACECLMEGKYLNGEPITNVGGFAANMDATILEALPKEDNPLYKAEQ